MFMDYTQPRLHIIVIKFKMKLYFIISFFLIFSCSSVKHEAGLTYKAVYQPNKYIKEIKHNGYQLDRHNFIRFSISNIDSISGKWDKYLVFYSRKSKYSPQVISKVDLSAGFYKDTLLIYKSNLSDKQVIIWKQEDEYWSYLHIFLFHQDNIILIADMSIGLDCEHCDAFNFPVNKINIQEINNAIKIKFLGQSIYRGTISPTATNNRNIKTDKLTVHFDKYGSRISY